jgi:hypothetical protein
MMMMMECNWVRFVLGLWRGVYQFGLLLLNESGEENRLDCGWMLVMMVEEEGYGGGVVVGCVGCGGEGRKRERKLVRGDVRRLLGWLSGGGSGG